MNKILLTFAIVLYFQDLSAQSLRYNLSMPYVQMSAYSSRQQDVFSFTGNQAALASLKQAGVGIYGERRFMLEETSIYSLAAALPTSLGNFGLQVNYSGFTNFNETKAGLAYGRSLGGKVDVGVQFNYYGYNIPVYGKSSTVNFEGGAILHFSDKFHGGIHIYSPVAGKLSKNTDEKLASAYTFGVGLDASENFFVSTQVVKEEDKPVNVTGGVQYQFRKQFFARAGFLSASESGYFGAGVKYKNLRLDVSASFHPQLGVTPGILLIANFGKVK